MSYDPNRERKDAAALCLRVRGVARLLGARYLEQTDGHHWHAIELAPTMHLHAGRSWDRKGMIRWSAHCPLARGYSAPSVCTSKDRAPAAIVADLRSRLIPAAREWCRKTILDQAQHQEREQQKRARLAELRAILGPMRESNGHHYAEGFEIRFDDLLGGYRGQVAAKVELSSWHCLLMVARLAAEDAKVRAASARGEDAAA